MKKLITLILCGIVLIGCGPKENKMDEKKEKDGKVIEKQKLKENQEDNKKDIEKPVSKSSKKDEVKSKEVKVPSNTKEEDNFKVVPNKIDTSSRKEKELAKQQNKAEKEQQQTISKKPNKPDVPEKKETPSKDKSPSKEEKQVKQETPKYTESSYAEEVRNLINEIRANNGAPALYSNALLTSVTQQRADHQLQRYGHYLPDGTHSGTWLENQGINPGGEDVAMMSQSFTPEAIVNSWMNSPGHREPILSNDSAYMDIAVRFYGGSVYVVACWAQ